MNKISLILFFIFNVIVFQANANLSEEEKIERTNAFLENAPKEAKFHLRLLISGVVFRI